MCRALGFLALLVQGLLARPALGDTGVNDQITSQSFQLRAEIVAGCLLGTGASDASTFGNLSFGQISTLSSNLDVVSSPGNGTIVLQCSPGTPVTVSLNAGLNATDAGTGRYLVRGSESLRYQLYQNNARTIVWGNGSNGGDAMSINFPNGGGSQSYPVYARLFNASPMPSAGLYTDTITVTVSY